MGSALSRTHSVSFSSTVHCTPEKALSVLHDPVALIDLNPLVVSRKQSPEDPSLWTIRDKMKTLGISYEFDYTARHTPHEDGASFDINAPAGVVLKNRWTVEKLAENTVKLTEKVDIEANLFLMPSVLSGLTPSHNQLHERLRARLEASASDHASGSPKTTVLNMGAALSQTRTVTFSSTVRCTSDKALAVLHDPLSVINLDPLVVFREKSATDPTLWNLRDRLKILGFINYDMKYTARVTPRDDGVSFDVNAPFGIKMNSRFSVAEVDEGVKVNEDVEVTTNALIITGVLSSMKPAHQQLHDRLGAQLEGRPTGAEPTTEQSSVSFYSSIILVLFSATLCFFALNPGWLRTLIVAGLLPVPFFRNLMSSKDPYGTFHLSLNKDPESTESAPRTEWLNMGYWKDISSFPEACEALALKMISAGNCQAGGRVLDIGHGSGDSLLLHLQHFSVPRPMHLTGITSLKDHHLRSLERVQQCQATLNVTHNVTLYHGDAVYRRSTEDGVHPLNPSSDSPPFTTIFALDCAYHFRTRSEFLKQSYGRLEEGGRIALADICFASSPVSGFSNKLVRRAIGLLGVMPKENMQTVDEYISSMRSIGYQDVTLEDITDDVFPGFELFLAKQGVGWSVFARMIGWLSTAGARFVIMSSLARASLEGEVVCIWDHGMFRTERVNGFFDAFKHVWKAEGLSGLWKGAGTTLIIGVPSATCYMMTYDHLLRVVLPPLMPSQTLVPLTAGILARTMITSVASPLELIRTNLQSTPLSPDTPHTLRSVLTSVSGMARAQGVRYLWRGLGPTLWRDVPFSGLYWAGYEACKSAFKRRGQEGASVAFVSGAVSGTTAALLTSPFDVLKTRRQALVMSHAGKSTATWPLVAEILRTEGISALYAGILPRIVKIAPACGIMIACFEGVGRFLSKPHDDRSP
ncbi:hypothetical protein EIP91_008851 [Steccherinum ochraceum]|uniref:DUF7053 domain-containing protein n=1 Tax=Steccherinum ochraceum TaxID=92696 RepID=A0A4R0RRN4_9APHY|nr:hypothetical protein EIP91_008851 [Steccherinum ochraceum]